MKNLLSLVFQTYILAIDQFVWFLPRCSNAIRNFSIVDRRCQNRYLLVVQSFLWRSLLYLLYVCFNVFHFFIHFATWYSSYSLIHYTDLLWLVIHMPIDRYFSWVFRVFQLWWFFEIYSNLFSFVFKHHFCVDLQVCIQVSKVGGILLAIWTFSSIVYYKFFMSFSLKLS